MKGGADTRSPGRLEIARDRTGQTWKDPWGNVFTFLGPPERDPQPASSQLLHPVLFLVAPSWYPEGELLGTFHESGSVPVEEDEGMERLG